MLASEMQEVEHCWAIADCDESKAMAAVCMLLMIPEGLEFLRMQMVLERAELMDPIRQNLERSYDLA